MVCLTIYLKWTIFEGVAVDGSTSFVPTARCPIQCDSSDEEAADEEDEQLTPLSNNTPCTIPSKRGSSTSNTARNPSKRSKSPAVRLADNNMTRHNELMSNKIDLIQNLWQTREAREEAACTEHRRRVQEVYKMAVDLGVSAKATPELFAGVMHIVENDNRMVLFFTSDPDGRLFMMKQYSRVDN
jgi:hypothetical protein